MNLSPVERFVLVELLLRQEGGQVYFTNQEVERLADSHDGWCAVLMLRDGGVTIKAVSPERRTELIAQGLVELDG